MLRCEERKVWPACLPNAVCCLKLLSKLNCQFICTKLATYLLSFSCQTRSGDWSAQYTVIYDLSLLSTLRLIEFRLRGLGEDNPVRLGPRGGGRRLVPDTQEGADPHREWPGVYPECESSSQRESESGSDTRTWSQHESKALISEPDPRFIVIFSVSSAIPVHWQSGRFALLPIQDTPESTLRRENYGHQEGVMSGDINKVN